MPTKKTKRSIKDKTDYHSGFIQIAEEDELYKVRNALATLQKANEIRADKKFMEKIIVEAQKQIKSISRISKIPKNK